MAYAIPAPVAWWRHRDLCRCFPGACGLHCRLVPRAALVLQLERRRAVRHRATLLVPQPAGGQRHLGIGEDRTLSQPPLPGVRSGPHRLIGPRKVKAGSRLAERSSWSRGRASDSTLGGGDWVSPAAVPEGAEERTDPCLGSVTLLKSTGRAFRNDARATASDDVQAEPCPDATFERVEPPARVDACRAEQEALGPSVCRRAAPDARKRITAVRSRRAAARAVERQLDVRLQGGSRADRSSKDTAVADACEHRRGDPETRKRTGGAKESDERRVDRSTGCLVAWPVQGDALARRVVTPGAAGKPPGPTKNSRTYPPASDSLAPRADSIPASRLSEPRTTIGRPSEPINTARVNPFATAATGKPSATKAAATRASLFRISIPTKTVAREVLLGCASIRHGRLNGSGQTVLPLRQLNRLLAPLS